MDLKPYLIEGGVPEELHEEALACFKSAKDGAMLRAFIGLLAPFVVGFMLLTRQLRWEHDKVPQWGWWYDNNISINGDGWGMLYPDGTCVWPVDFAVLDRGEAIAIPYGDLRWTGDCYYAKGHHPRSKWARWIWLGFRNRASALAMAKGKQINLSDTPVHYGAQIQPSRTNEGFRITRMSGVWQFYQIKKVFFGKLAMTRNIGYKVNNAIGEQNTTAMCIYYQQALKKWKGE